MSDVSQSATAESQVVVSAATARRLARDVRELQKSPLDDLGVHYAHDTSHMLRGRALVIGPRDTPYEGGYFFFSFEFPPNYPHAPPRVVYHTNDGHTRMNPNLYRNGKVCLSILNTWRGDQWTGCQTIRSVLVSICGCVFTDAPLLNEPGITRSYKDYEKYNEIVRHQTFRIGIIDMLTRPDIEKQFAELVPIMRTHFTRSHESILERLERICDEGHLPGALYATSIYGMKVVVDYPQLSLEIRSLGAAFSDKLK